ncbi:hypothetical protein HUJ05_003510 [Dendroctonus ponderosae]|nr:hypothetical protein HUJ05_003510 [Dendroctonus ponderosae]
MNFLMLVPTSVTSSPNTTLSPTSRWDIRLGILSAIVLYGNGFIKSNEFEDKFRQCRFFGQKHLIDIGLVTKKGLQKILHYRKMLEIDIFLEKKL